MYCSIFRIKRLIWKSGSLNIIIYLPTFLRRGSCIIIFQVFCLVLFTGDMLWVVCDFMQVLLKPLAEIGIMTQMYDLNS